MEGLIGAGLRHRASRPRAPIHSTKPVTYIFIYVGIVWIDRRTDRWRGAGADGAEDLPCVLLTPQWDRGLDHNTTAVNTQIRSRQSSRCWGNHYRLMDADLAGTHLSPPIPGIS